MTMVDMEVPKKVIAPTEIGGGKELVTPTARIAELELQVKNLEQPVTKAQEEKEQSRGELMAQLKEKKSEVRVWKYRLGCCFRRLKKVAKKLSLLGPYCYETSSRKDRKDRSTP